jgi:ABC-type branched-subunit amino acid transport system substrate-binding protein
VVKREFTTNTATDFNAILTSIKATKPDVIFYGGMDAQAGPLAKQMDRLGIKAKLMGGDGWQTPEFIKLAGALPKVSTPPAAAYRATRCRALLPSTTSSRPSSTPKYKSTHRMNTMPYVYWLMP